MRSIVVRPQFVWYRQPRWSFTARKVIKETLLSDAMHAVHERPGTFHTTNDEVVIIASRIRPAYLFPTNQVHQDLSQISISGTSILWTLN